MSIQRNVQGDLNFESRATLSLLSVLEEGESITQRGLSMRIGVALGLTNSLIKRAVRKGLIKVGQAPAKRFAYYVTPKGFREKSNLVAEYLSSSLSFFRRARDEYFKTFEEIAKRGCRKVAMYGNGELAEIALLSAREAGVEICCVVQPGSNNKTIGHVRICSLLSDPALAEVDAIVIVGTTAPQNDYDELTAHFEEDLIFAVPLLHVCRAREGEKA